MKLGDRTPYDFSKLDLGYMGNEGIREADIRALDRAMSEKLSHDDIIRTLSDPSVKCHVDSYFRPVSQKEAAIRVARSGAEYCCAPEPAGMAHAMDMRVIRTMIMAGSLAGFLEDSLRERGIEAAIEMRADLNRFNTLSASYPDGRIGLFVDVGGICPPVADDEALRRIFLQPVSDLSAVALMASMFHMARHAVQLDMFRKGGLDPIYDGMKSRFLAGCDDPAYYMASYPENMMCLEAEIDAVFATEQVLRKAWPDVDAEALLLDYLNYKLMYYNTENLIFPAMDGTLPSWEHAVVGLISKLYKIQEWYAKEPDHDRTVTEEYREAAGWKHPGGRKPEEDPSEP